MVIVLPTATDSIRRPEYYVVLCARRYAAAAEALKLAATDIERANIRVVCLICCNPGCLRPALNRKEGSAGFPMTFVRRLSRRMARSSHAQSPRKKPSCYDMLTRCLG